MGHALQNSGEPRSHELGWLVRQFIEPAASFRFVDPGDVARIQREDGGLGFDAPGARYPHKDSAGRCSFEALVQECQPLGTFDRISLADVNWDTGTAMVDAVGLRTISRGFPLITADDFETLERSAFLYDALYASLRSVWANEAGWLDGPPSWLFSVEPDPRAARRGRVSGSQPAAWFRRHSGWPNRPAG